MQGIGINMFQMQHNMVFIRANAAAFVDFYGHGAADNIAAGQIFGCWRKPFHKALALGIGQIATLTTRPFGDQYTGTIDASRVKLDKFHIL